MITVINKKDERIEAYGQDEIAQAITKAFSGASDYARAEEIGRKVAEILRSNLNDNHSDLESVQELVAKVLIENVHDETAKAYIYGQRREITREIDTTIGQWASKHSFL